MNLNFKHGKRAVSRSLIIIVVVVIVIIALAGGYAALSSSKPSSTSSSSLNTSTSSTGGGSTSSSGASSSSSTSAAQSGNSVPNPGVFVEENTIEPGPGGLDPALAWDPSDMFFLNVYQNLMWFNGSDPTTFLPWLAQNYTISPNATQYTFNLRQGITFQDGTPFNATAVKFSYDRAVLINHADGPEFLFAYNITMGIRGAPEYTAANTTHATNMPAAQAYLNAGGVKVLSTYTVQFNLEHPYSAALATLAWESGGAIISPSYVIAHCNGTSLTPGVTPGIECQYMLTHMMGTGPFMLSSYTPKSEIDFVRFDKYWGSPFNTGPAKLKEYIVKDIQQVGTRELDLLSGAADAISLPASNAFDLINQQVYKSNGSIVPTKQGIRIWESPTNGIASLTIDPRFPPLNDSRFRMAMAYAFPYQQFIQNVSNGFAVKLNGYLTPKMFGYDPNIKGYDYNATKAKELFTQVGFKGTISLTLDSSDATSIAAVVLFKSSIQTIDPDITINIQEVDDNTYLTLFHEFKVPVFAACCWVPDIADGSETLANWATPNGFTGETTQFNSTTVTKDMNIAAASLNQTLRAQLYSQVQQAMLTYAGSIPLYSPDAIYAERTWVLPADSPIGRGLYNPQYGDGSGGVIGGYYAYNIDKAASTPFSIALSISPSLGTFGSGVLSLPISYTATQILPMLSSLPKT
ncbi:MAG: ABC transporter substrate-binding protein [Thaumarchaeota archaeon]|nr:ABC transporter substrate-binding protein [Nitrososphaerota archaeon]